MRRFIDLQGRSEKRYNDGLTAITTVAEEDVQVVGKQLDQSMVGQLLKMYRQLFKKSW